MINPNARLIGFGLVTAIAFIGSLDVRAQNRGSSHRDATSTLNKRSISSASSARSSDRMSRGHCGEAEAETEVRQVLGPAFVRSTTEHFVIYSDADALWTAEQAGRLERAHDEFFDSARALGLEPRSLGRRLLCVLFEDRDDFSDFARSQDRVREAWIGGYYSTTANYIVFYNSNDDRPSYRASRADNGLRFVTTESDGGASVDGDRYFNAGDDAGHHRGHDRSAAKTVHEAIHQLAHNTGVMGRDRRYPFWAAEGMATVFETDRPELDFGPDHEHAGRRERFDELRRDDALIRLRRFVQMDRIGANDSADVVYHQSYALFKYLYEYRRDSLASYLTAMAMDADELGAPPAGRLTADEHLAIFEQHFGSVEIIERAWLWHERHRD